jgi:hypothetical protein
MKNINIAILITLIQTLTISCCYNRYEELEIEPFVPVLNEIAESEDPIFVNSADKVKIIYTNSEFYSSQEQILSLRELGVSQMYFYSKEEVWFVMERFQHVYKQSEVLVGYCSNGNSIRMSTYRCIVEKGNGWYFAQHDLMMD